MTDEKAAHEWALKNAGNRPQREYLNMGSYEWQPWQPTDHPGYGAHLAGQAIGEINGAKAERARLWDEIEKAGLVDSVPSPIYIPTDDLKRIFANTTDSEKAEND